MEGKTNFSKILDKIPKDLTDLEKARWLYIQLGRKFKYDMNVFYMSEEEMGEQYNQNPNVDIENTNKTICKPINEIYIELLRRLGIAAELKQVSKNYTYNHVGTVIILPEQNLTIFTDLTIDLYRIQQGLMTDDFAFTSPDGEYDIISRKELKDIDNKIEYTYLNLYMNEFIDLIAKEMKDDDTVRKYISKDKDEELLTTEKFEFLLKQLPLDRMGYVEARNFLLYLINTVFKPQDKAKINQYDLFRELGNGQREFVNCIVIRENETNYYIQEDGKDLRKIDKTEMEEMLHNGWNNRKKKKILGQAEEK